MTDESVIYTILVVDGDSATRAGTVKALRDAGYRVDAVGSFNEAKSFLATTQPDLLIADIRLEYFNGLQLVLQRHADHPGKASVVTNTYADQVLEREARAVGAPYLVKPVSAAELLRVSAGLLEKAQSSADEKRRWRRKSITDGLEALIDHTQATVLEVSYGGFRLQFQRIAVAPFLWPFQVAIPTFNVVVRARPVWRTMASGRLTCGAALVESEEVAASAWRAFVDQLA